MTDAYTKAALRGGTAFVGHLYFISTLIAWACVVQLLMILKGVLFLFNCAKKEDGFYYHRMVGDGNDWKCFDPGHEQFYLMLLILPVPFFLIFALRLRRIDAKLSGLPSSLLSRLSLYPSDWKKDKQPCTRYHTLVPNENSTQYPFIFALIRVVYAFTELGLLAFGSFVLLGVALKYPPFSIVSSNSLNLSIVVVLLWTNVCSFINTLDAHMNGGSQGEVRSDGQK